MAFYEVTYITRPALTKAELDRLAERFCGIITEAGGKIIKQEYWGLRSLAYPIQKSTKGHYTMLGIETEAAALFELERNLRLSEEVMRNLTVHVEQMDDSPSVVIRERNGDEKDAA